MWSKGLIIIVPCMLAIIAIALVACVLYFNRKKNQKYYYLPFLIVTIMLIVGETFKQIIGIVNGLTNPPYDKYILPFSVCASNIIWFSFICFGKKDSFIKNIGYTIGYTTSFITAIIYLIMPKLLFNIPDNGNMFEEYNIFWGCVSHTLIFFCGIWLLIYRPYKISNMYILWASIIAIDYLFFIGIMCHVFNENWQQLLHNFPLPNLFPEDTWGYTIIAIVYSLVAAIASICLYKFVFCKYIPQFAYVKKGKNNNL